MSGGASIDLTDLLKRLQELKKGEGHQVTLLAINPMSSLIVRATLELAKEDQFPVMFIATRNQVEKKELGGGYILDWDQEKFVQDIKEAYQQTGFKGPLFICRDHGGPWLRDDEFRRNLPEKEAMERVKASFLADVLAGFNVLHVDGTVDPHFEGYVPLNLVTQRTVEIIEYVENKRKKEGLRKVGYEVGAEKTAGGHTDFEEFEEFLSPELSAVEVKAYLKLGDKEKEAVEQGRLKSPSNFISVLQERAVESERWRKWLGKDQTHLTKEDIVRDPKVLTDITIVSGRYVMGEESVSREREKLFQNLRNLKIVADPERKIIQRVKESLARWINDLNLKNLNSRIS